MEYPSSSSRGGAGDRRDSQAPRGGYPVADLDGLMRQVQAVIENEDDTEVQQVLRQHYHEVPPLRPEMRAVLRMTALVVYNMRVNGSRLTPRSALILLAQADWDVELAQYRYQQQRDSDDSGEAKEESERSDGEEDEEDEEDEEEEEGEDDGAGSDEPEDRFSIMRRLNQGIDRTVAKRYQPDDSKLFIRIHHPGGKRDTTFTYPRQPVDWTQPVKAINRWRSQILRRNLGAARPFRTHFHPDEKEWLFQEHLRFERQRQAQGLIIDYSAMRWGDIMNRFNNRFAGKVLPGSSEPRPARTKVALRTERARIDKITDHTGIPSTNRRASKANRSQESEESDEGSDEDELEYGPVSTRRGDPPPGKPPRRDEDDDNIGGGIGGRAERRAVGVKG